MEAENSIREFSASIPEPPGTTTNDDHEPSQYVPLQKLETASPQIAQLLHHPLSCRHRVSSNSIANVGSALSNEQWPEVDGWEPCERGSRPVQIR